MQATLVATLKSCPALNCIRVPSAMMTALVMAACISWRIFVSSFYFCFSFSTIGRPFLLCVILRKDVACPTAYLITVSDTWSVKAKLLKNVKYEAFLSPWFSYFGMLPERCMRYWIIHKLFPPFIRNVKVCIKSCRDLFLNVIYLQTVPVNLKPKLLLAKLHL